MRKFIFLSAVLFLLVMVGCSNTVDIAEIDKNPGKYLNTECIVKGHVTDVKDIPLLKNDFFKINDSSGEIWVYTEKGVPPEKIEVKIKGILKRVLDIPILNKVGYYIELQEMEFL